MSSVWLVQEGWCVYDGNQQSPHPWDTSTISCLTIVHLRTNLPWNMVTWMTRGWSRDPMILKTMEPRSFCDCCCGVWNFWNWNMETFKRKLIESFWHEPPPKSSLPGEYERNPNRLGYPIYPIILASFSYLRRLWTLGISTRNESTISLDELSLWCFCFWMLDFMVSPTMKISEACTVYYIYMFLLYDNSIYTHIYIYICTHTVYTWNFRW